MNWFRALCAAMFLAMLWAAYQFRVRQLQRVSKQLRDVIDTIPGYVWSARPDGSLDFINRRWLEFSGVSLEEGLGWGWEAAVHPDDLTRFVDEWRAAVASGTAMESEARVRRADGQYRWLLIRNVPLRDKVGKIVKWYGTSADIDDRKRAEETLREQADLLSLTHDTIFVMTMEGVIKYWNRGAEEQYGWTAEQAVGRSVHDLLKTVFPALLEQIKAEVVRTGRWEGELVHTKKDETQVVVASRWSLQRGEQGAPIAILETNNDITERKRAEEALGRSNRELRAISNCNQTLLRATDEQSLLEEICRIVCEEAGYRMAWVGYTEHDEARTVRPATSTGAEEGYLATAGITWADTERGRGPTGTAIRSGKTCCIQDFATDPRMMPWRESLLQRGVRSGIALPLKGENDNAFGSLTIHSAQPNAFTPEEIRLLEELAGDLAFGIVTLRSQAARKRAEEAQRESETRFRTFVDHAGDALFVYDLEKRTVIDVNRQACESMGYTRQELIGKTPDALHLESYQAEMEFVVERAATGETVVDTHWHRRKDGSTFPVEAHTTLVSYGGHGFVLTVCRDITDRLRAEEAIRQSERQLRDVIEGIPAIASTLRLDGSVEFINKRWQEYTGMSAEGSVGPEWQSAGHPQDMDHYLEKRRAALASGDPFEDEARIRSRDGKYRWFLLRGVPLRDERGNIVRWYATAIDIEDRKQAEEMRLEERVRERTRIARELHDTLLQSFQGTLLHFQVASSLLPTRTAEAKERLDSAIDIAAQAITEGRDAIQGLRSPEFEINDLAVAIRTFGESLAADRGDDGSPVFQVELVGVAGELDPTFAGEVYRIAIEALRNSFQHAEARQIKVEIHYEENEFRVLVRDDGKGIDSKSLAAEGRQGHYGLHGMRERAKLIGSEIAIRSEVGAGTEVELRVPAVTAYAAYGVIL